MTIDALALAAVCQEADTLLQGCRIQKIIPTGALSIVLEAYNPEYRRRVQFILSADAQNARFHMLSKKASQMPGEANPFMLVLRRYLRYGIVTAIDQMPFERIIILTIAKKFPASKRPSFAQKGGARLAIEEEIEVEDTELEQEEEFVATDEETEIYESKLVCEIMGRHSNIMLLSEDNLIIDAIKRVASGRNRYRTILPHQPYIAPPPQEKRLLHHESPAEFVHLLEGSKAQNPNTPLWQALVSSFSGVSPQLAREIAYRTAPENSERKLADTHNFEAVYSELKDLMRPLYQEDLARLKASLVRDKQAQIVAFAPYELRQFIPDGLEPEQVESLSLAAEEYYAQLESVSGQSQRKQQIADVVGEHQDKLKRRATSLEESLKRAESAELLRRKGEAIYSNLYEISEGATSLVADGLKITLDPRLSSSDNAQAYFREYDKARKALAGVPELVEETRLELDYLEEMLTQLELAETFEEVMYLKAEFDEAGYGSRPKDDEKSKKAAAKTRKKRKILQTPVFISSDGFTILVGKSAQHNEYVTFQLGDKQDIWLHARGMPGSHVIIKSGSRDVPERTMVEAAALAAYYSKGQNSTRVEVTYVPQKFVRKVKGAHPGLVTYTNDRSLNVKPMKLVAKKPAARS
ncbi:MAG: fibronectin/fibrinogen-binding protein [Chloroflexi bacterium]|uniref:Fibronectin/fibrinogen-binding protein n=1 Tax=Candidatus Chlorohelix allophototropha TaxID=3003348 RepID=A0A8T7LXP6_9CHLR|nr:fibronectin/fibrinogen-binding protein [Chloroflexota bacterium]WJW67527.1 NFACT family protein [Chloroflexota bacterium L227-S17]